MLGIKHIKCEQRVLQTILPYWEKEQQSLSLCYKLVQAASRFWENYWLTSNHALLNNITYYYAKYYAYARIECYYLWIYKKHAPLPKYWKQLLKDTVLILTNSNTHIISYSLFLSLSGLLFTRTHSVVSKWVCVHLRQLAYLKIPYNV